MADSDLIPRLKARCNICLDEFSDARRLPCGHLFCAKCLMSHIKQSTDPETQEFQCVDCSTSHPAPRPLNMNAIHRTYPEPPRGHIKGTGAEDVKRSRLTCSVKGHEGEEVILYCSDHKVTICARCVVSKHKKCNNTHLSVAVSEHKENIQRLSQNVSDYVKQLKNVMKETNINFDSLLKQASNMKSEIRLTVKTLKKKLDDEEQHLLREVDQLVKNARENAVKSAQTVQESSAVKLLSAATDAGKSQDVELLPVHDTELEKEWRRLTAVGIPTVRFRCNIERKKMGGVVVGEIQVHRERKKAGGVQSGVVEGRKGRVGDIPIQGKIISGIVSIDGTTLIVQNENSEMSVYSRDNKLLTRVKVPGLKDPYPGMVYLGTDQGCVQLVLGDYNGEALHFVSLSPDWRVNSHRKQQLEFTPSDITLDTASRQLVVVDNRNKRVLTYNTTGTSIATVQLDGVKIVDPGSAVRLGSLFVVADYLNKQVVWVDMKGKVYKGPDHQPLRGPYRLAVDSVTGHVMVVDLDGACIHEVDEHGAWVRTVLQEQDGLCKPTCVHLSEDGLLYTGHGRRNMFIKITECRPPSSHGHLNVVETTLSATLTLNQC